MTKYNEAHFNRSIQALTEDLAAKNAKVSEELTNTVVKLLEDQTKKQVEALEKQTSVIEALSKNIGAVNKLALLNESAIAENKEEISYCKAVIASLSRDLEDLRIQAKAKNLIFYGVKELEGENRAVLKKEIMKIIQQHYGLTGVIIEFPFRLGDRPKDKEKSWPILVPFNLKNDKDAILYRKRPPGCPVSVKADLPKETAAKRSILGQLTGWAKDHNKKFRRTDHYVSIEGVRYNHVEAKAFLEAFPDHSLTENGNSSGTPME